MNRLTLPTVLMVTLLVVSVGAVGAAAAPLASGEATAPAMQEGDGNTTATPTVNGSADSTNGSDTNDTNTTSEELTFGAVVSSFMQTSAADAENEVEDGLFAAQFERSNVSERARLVRQRASNIGTRIAELREERARLLDGGNATVRERAEAARLAEQSDSLSSSIEQTESAAARANVQLNETTLGKLRSEARNLTGSEVADLARGLVDRDDSAPRGPPEDRGPDREGTDAVGNETAANANETAANANETAINANETVTEDGVTNERTPRSGDGSNGGPPEDRPGEGPPSDDETPTASPTETADADGSDSTGDSSEPAEDDVSDGSEPSLQ